MSSEISFRPFRIGDAEPLISWASSPDELLQWTGPGFSFPLDHRQLAAYAATAGEHCRLISGEAAKTNEVVAHAQLDILPEHELGQIRRVAVAPQMRGRGVGLALMRCLVELAFDQLGLHGLELVVFSHNDAARRCYERVGFRQEGQARHARKASEGYWVLIYMALLEDRYRKDPGDASTAVPAPESMLARPAIGFLEPAPASGRSVRKLMGMGDAVSVQWACNAKAQRSRARTRARPLIRHTARLPR